MVPISLELRNFFSHRRTIIDFTQFDSALLIGNTEGDYNLSNGSGKSAVFESILWCLFNKARVAAMDDIILWGEESCSVAMTFRQDGVLYKVVRSRSRVTGTSQVTFAYLSEDNDWIDISGSTAGLTNSKIVEIVKFDYKTFVNSAYFRQNDISEFAESDPGRKKEILKSIIDLSKWDDYERESKSRLKTIKSDAEILQAKIEELDIDEISLAKAISQSNALEEELKTLVQKQAHNSESLEKMINRYQELKTSLDTDQWDKIVAENRDLKIKAGRLTEKISQLSPNIAESQRKLDFIVSQIEDLDSKLTTIVVDNEIDEKIKKIRDSLIVYRSRLSTASSLLEILDKKNIDEGVCNVCGQEISADLHNDLIHTHNEEREKYNKEIIFSNNKIEECNALLRKYEEIQKDNKRAEAFRGKLRTLRAQKEIAEESLKNKFKELNDAQEDLAGVDSKIKSNQLILESLKNDDFQKLHIEIEKKRSLKKSLDDKIASQNQEIGVLSQKIKTLTESIEKMRQDKTELLALNKKRAAYEKLSKLLGKNGIQTILLNAVIEDLEKTANQILVSICNEPLSIFLETQRVGSDGVSLVDTLDLRVKKDGITQNFKSLSGGEQFRISLSLRIALSEISSRHGGSSLEFLLLDEINSPLDRHGTENLFVNVIRSLEKKYKILVITHNDSLKERFSNVIEITKVNGESTAQFIQK